MLQVRPAVCAMSSSLCEHRVWVGACDVCKPIHTSRDQAWHFQHPTLGYIDSKGEFDRRCKAKGLVRVSTDDLVTRGEPTKPSMPKVDPKMIGNLVQEIKQQATPDRVEAKWRESQAKAKQAISPTGVDYAGVK